MSHAASLPFVDVNWKVPDRFSNSLMLAWLQQLVPFVLGVVAIAYAGLAVRVIRSGREYSNSMSSLLMLLFAGFLAGAALSTGATDARAFGIGRTLSFLGRLHPDTSSTLSTANTPLALPEVW